MKVDMRSDTVTKPSKEMIEAMFNASVGDDVLKKIQVLMIYRHLLLITLGKKLHCIVLQVLKPIK